MPTFRQPAHVIVAKNDLPRFDAMYERKNGKDLLVQNSHREAGSASLVGPLSVRRYNWVRGPQDAQGIDARVHKLIDRVCEDFSEKISRLSTENTDDNVFVRKYKTEVKIKSPWGISTLSTFENWKLSPDSISANPVIELMDTNPPAIQRVHPWWYQPFVEQEMVKTLHARAPFKHPEGIPVSIILSVSCRYEENRLYCDHLDLYCILTPLEQDDLLDQTVKYPVKGFDVHQKMLDTMIMGLRTSSIPLTPVVMKVTDMDFYDSYPGINAKFLTSPLELTLLPNVQNRKKFIQMLYRHHRGRQIAPAKSVSDSDDEEDNQLDIDVVDELFQELKIDFEGLTLRCVNTGDTRNLCLQFTDALHRVLRNFPNFDKWHAQKDKTSKVSRDAFWRQIQFRKMSKLRQKAIAWKRYNDPSALVEATNFLASVPYHNYISHFPREEYWKEYEDRYKEYLQSLVVPSVGIRYDAMVNEKSNYEFQNGIDDLYEKNDRFTNQVANSRMGMDSWGDPQSVFFEKLWQIQSIFNMFHSDFPQLNPHEQSTQHNLIQYWMLEALRSVLTVFHNGAVPAVKDVRTILQLLFPTPHLAAYIEECFNNNYYMKSVHQDHFNGSQFKVFPVREDGFLEVKQAEILDQVTGQPPGFRPSKNLDFIEWLPNKETERTHMAGRSDMAWYGGEYGLSWGSDVDFFNGQMRMYMEAFIGDEIRVGPPVGETVEIQHPGDYSSGIPEGPPSQSLESEAKDSSQSLEGTTSPAEGLPGQPIHEAGDHNGGGHQVSVGEREEQLNFLRAQRLSEEEEQAREERAREAKEPEETPGAKRIRTRQGINKDEIIFPVQEELDLDGAFKVFQAAFSALKINSQLEDGQGESVQEG